MAGVFINYRRDDAKSEAGRVFDWLSRYFGKDQVFMDVSGSIEPGLEFDTVIEKAVSSCDALIVVIGKEWLTAADEKGKRRLDDPNDFVRLEIAAALRRDIRVIPVLVQGAAMPDEGSLPDDLKRLSKRQASEISDNRWEFDTQQLVKVLEKAGVKASPGQAIASDEHAAPPQQATKKFGWKAIAGMAFAAILILAYLETPTISDPPEPPVVDTQPLSDLPVRRSDDARHRGVVDTQPLSDLPVPAPSVPASPVTTPAVPEQPAASFADISGSWRGPDGIYVFQQSGNTVNFQLFDWNRLLIAQGTGSIAQGAVMITYVRVDNTGGEARLRVSTNGRQMAGAYRNLVTGEAGPVSLVR